MTTIIVKDKEKGRDHGKLESIKPEGEAGEKRKFEEVFQSTKKEEIANQNKKEKIESTVAGSKTYLFFIRRTFKAFQRGVSI